MGGIEQFSCYLVTFPMVLRERAVRHCPSIMIESPALSFCNQALFSATFSKHFERGVWVCSLLFLPPFKER